MSIARGVLSLLAILAVVWLAVMVLAWVFQRQLIYLPDRSPPSLPPALDVEEVTLTTEDGLVLGAWFVPAVDDPVSTVLVAPGNAGNRSHRMLLAAGLSDRGHSVLLLDYRGYGGNAGRPDEPGLVTDARAAHDHLVARPDVDPERIVYLGESLGSGVVAALASERPPAGLALRSPFPSLADVGAHHYPFLPVRTLLRDRHATTRHLAAYDGPVLVVAGGADTIVPTALSRQVAAAADATYVEVPGADHNDRELLDGSMYLDAVDALAREAVG